MPLTPCAHSTTVPGLGVEIRTPRLTRISMRALTSRMEGTLWSVTSSSVRSVAANRGNAAFLFPLGAMVPEMGCPPSI